MIAPAYDEHVVEFWRSLLDTQTVQAKLGREGIGYPYPRADGRKRSCGRKA
jgi:hypothetical protein